jgi:hypothetical protein
MPFWVGDPLRGFGRNQPGGWIYNVLPYVEANSIRQLPDDGDADRITEQQKTSAAGMIQIPLEVMQCPTRRPARPYPYVLNTEWDVLDAASVDRVARSDFAANGGDAFDDKFPFLTVKGDVDQSRFSSIDAKVAWADTDAMNGVCFMRSEIRAAQIEDGLSNTYLIGEKYVDVGASEIGWDPGDNHSMYQGFDRDIVRWAGPAYAPHRDQEGLDASQSFGSIHPEHFNMLLCDGSVHVIDYSIDLEVHRAAANRHDAK